MNTTISRKQIVEAFLDAATNVHKTQADFTFTCDVIRPLEPQQIMDVAAVAHIDIKGRPINGYFRICYPANAILQVSNSMLGENFQQLDEDVLNVACELANMIYGVGKAELNKKCGVEFEKAFPQLLAPEQIASFGDEIITFPCQTPAGTCYMQFGFLA